MLKSLDFNKFRDNAFLHFALLFAAVLLFVGKTVPYDNEYAYLPRLVKTYNDNFLLNDAIFHAPANEHWLFNHLFGLLTFVFSIEFIGWSSRIACWAILLVAMLRLGKHWEIPLWMITCSILLWLCQGQSFVGEEWIFGSFEAKCVAYICLLFALDGFCREKIFYPAILLGLTFSFHPAVGMWGILGISAALLICRRNLAELIKIGVLTVVFALPGLIAMLPEITQTASVEDWKYIELVKLPLLFDPFSWSKNAIVLLYMLLAFSWLSYLPDETSKPLRFLNIFLAVLGLFFTAGIVLRGFEQFSLLRYMPMRLFPVFAPLFFFFAFAKAFERNLFALPLKAVALIGFLCLFLWQNPAATAFNQIYQTVETWRTPPDEAAKSFAWLRGNTMNGTTIIAPPWRKDFWYWSHRAEVVNSSYPPYADLRQWRERLEELTGEAAIEKGARQPEEMSDFYNHLTTAQINDIAERCRAEYLVTESEYDYPIVFESGNYKIYQLNKAP